MVTDVQPLTTCRNNCTETDVTLHPDDIIQSLSSVIVTATTPVLCLVSVVLIVGTCGNLLVFCTYFTRHQKSSTNFFIFCLATFDIINCCFGLPMEIFGLLHPLTYDKPWLCKFHKLIVFAADLSSGCTIVCISFDRYRKITRPYRGLKIQTSRIAVVFISVSAIIIASFALYVYGTESVSIASHPSITGHRCGITDVAKTTKVPLIFNLVLLACFAVGVGILLVVYTRLGLRVRKWNKRRKHDGIIKPPSSDESQCRCESQTDGMQRHPESTNRANAEPTGAGESADNPCAHAHDPEDQDIPQIEPTENLLRPGYVREMSRSLDRHVNFIQFTQYHADGCSTLPLKHVKAVAPNSRKVEIARRKSVINTISVFKKSIKLSKTTVMFIVATLAFVICHIPYNCIKLINVLGPTLYVKQSEVDLTFYELAEYSFVISYAINPLIYSFVNPKFRKECKSLLQDVVMKTCKTSRTYHL